MKRLFSKLALVFAITLMAGFVSSCSSNDDDNVENTSKEYTYYITTDKITIDAGSPFTKDQLAKIYNDELNKECHDNWIDYKTLLNAVFNIYIIQNMEEKVKYIHGMTTVMCHVKSTNKEIALFNYDIDTNMVTEL